MIARGRVLGVRGGLVEIAVPALRLGSAVRITCAHGGVGGTIVALTEGGASVALHGSSAGVAAGNLVAEDPGADRLPLGMAALGRAIDSAGVALDDGPRVRGPLRAVRGGALAMAERGPIAAPLWTGVAAIDALLTVGRGARVGLFGPPGAGESTLVESIVRYARADAIVVGLIGERGREARGWIDCIDRRTTIVAATSDRAPSERVRAAHIAFAQARALAARGLHVLLVLDSLARFAAAARELALAAGEPVGRGGYPPSVFAELAALVERAGACTRGSVTLVATVLSEGDARDPVSEAARSLLDGHIVLSAELAEAGQFPAIDVLASTSRTMGAVAAPAHLAAALRVRRALSLLARTADARALGLGARDDATLRALEVEPALLALLSHGERAAAPDRTLATIAEIADILGEADGYLD